MSDYAGAFPPPPDDDPPPPPAPPAQGDGGAGYHGAFPPPPTDGAAVAVAPPLPTSEHAHHGEAPPRGRLGTFVLDLPDAAPAEDGGPGHEQVGHAGADREGGAATAVRPFDVVMFDFVGMLVSSPMPAIAALGPGLGIDGPKLLDLVFGPYGTQDSDHPFHRLERNEISTATYADHLSAAAAELGVHLEFDALRPLFVNLDVHEVVVEYVLELRRDGYRTVLVTNNTREVALAWRQLLPLGQLFELVVDSSSQGIRKPNPAFFRQALHLLGDVPPGRAVLLDDSLGNTEAAKGIGMGAIHVVRDPVQGLRQLNVLLGRHEGDDDFQ